MGPAVTECINNIQTYKHTNFLLYIRDSDELVNSTKIESSDDYLPITTCNALNVIELTRKRDHATFHHLHRVSVLRDVAEVRVRLAAAVVAAAAAAVLAV